MASLQDKIKLWLAAYFTALLTFIAFNRGVFQTFPFGYPWFMTFSVHGVPDLVYAGVTFLASTGIVWWVYEGYEKHISPTELG